MWLESFSRCFYYVKETGTALLFCLWRHNQSAAAIDWLLPGELPSTTHCNRGGALRGGGRKHYRWLQAPQWSIKKNKPTEKSSASKCKGRCISSSSIYKQSLTGEDFLVHWTEEMTQRQPRRKHFRTSWFTEEKRGLLQSAGEDQRRTCQTRQSAPSEATGIRANPRAAPTRLLQSAPTAGTPFSMPTALPS